MRDLLATPPANRKGYFHWSVSASAFQTSFRGRDCNITEIKLQNYDKPDSNIRLCTVRDSDWEHLPYWYVVVRAIEIR